MSPASSSPRRFAIALAIAAVPLSNVAAFAGWSVDPVEVHATTNSCPQVAASADAAHGAIVVWQELLPGSDGVLRARHLLATGDVDPAWPAPAEVCATGAARSALGSVADGLGGAYVWWLENASLYLTRIAPDGSIATGWPARGRMLGMLQSASQRPNVLGDGAHGVYLMWLQMSSLDVVPLAQIRATHLGPANTGAGGWSGSVHTLGSTADASEWVHAASIGLAPDGGIWLAWATSIVGDSDFQPGDWRLTRLLTSGVPATGWTVHGTSVAPFHGELLYHAGRLALALSLDGVAGDGADGAYLVRADPQSTGPDTWELTSRLQRYGSDALPASGWPAAGITIGGLVDEGASAGASLRAVTDDRGGVFAGYPGFFSEFIVNFTFDRYSPAGSPLPGGVGSGIGGIDFETRGDGGMFLASYHPNGPYSPWDPNAYISASQSDPGAGYAEYHDNPVQTWYGDIALASAGDGGAIFAWSQQNERFGVFAVRLGSEGLVTGVPPSAATANGRVAVRWAAGVGVRARASFARQGRVRCTLHDLSGRLLSRATFESPTGEAEWTMPGTEALASGLYFIRVESNASVRSSKVAITR